MKFVLIALVGVASILARTTTIKINEDTLEKIARTWETNERELERTLEKLNQEELKELDPYFKSVEKTVKHVAQINEYYMEKAGKETESIVRHRWRTTYLDMGCDLSYRKWQSCSCHEKKYDSGEGYDKCYQEECEP